MHCLQCPYIGRGSEIGGKLVTPIAATAAYETAGEDGVPGVGGDVGAVVLAVAVVVFLASLSFPSLTAVGSEECEAVSAASGT